MFVGSVSAPASSGRRPSGVDIPVDIGDTYQGSGELVIVRPSIRRIKQ
jgi:hypothetical protein